MIVNNKTRVMALALVFCFFIIYTFAQIYITSHYSHRHNHNGIGGTCTTCSQIQRVENTIRHISSGFCTLVFFMVTVLIGSCILKYKNHFFIKFSLVLSKVRMNN